MFPRRVRLCRFAVVKCDVPESVMALEIVSPLLLFVKIPPVAVVVTIDELLNARVPPVMVKNEFWPVPPSFVNESELTEMVPMSLMLLVRVAPPNWSEKVPVGAGRRLVPQFAWGDQLLFEPPPVQVDVAADAIDGLMTASRMAKNGTVRRIVRAIEFIQSVHREVTIKTESDCRHSLALQPA